MYANGNSKPSHSSLMSILSVEHVFLVAFQVASWQNFYIEQTRGNASCVKQSQLHYGHCYVLKLILRVDHLAHDLANIFHYYLQNTEALYLRMPGTSDTACLSLMLPWGAVNARLTTSTSRFSESARWPIFLRSSVQGSVLVQSFHAPKGTFKMT